MYKGKSASLVMMRSGVQFSLAAPPNPQWLSQDARYWLRPDYLYELHLRAEQCRNAQRHMGKIRAVCSSFALAVTSACGGGGGSTPASPPPPVSVPAPAPDPQPDPASKPFRIICTGQSNMVGSNKDTTGQRLEDDEVTVWVDGFKTSRLYEEPYRIPTQTFSAPNNMCHWFAIRAHEELERPVEIAFRARDGGSIVLWADGGEVWEPLVEIGNAAFSADAPADVILWGQGETDHNMPVAEYEASFRDTIDRLKAHDWVSDDAPVLVMELAQNGARSNMNQLHSNWSGPDFWTASSANLFTDDAIHFTGQSLQELGYERMWDAWVRANQ